MKNPTQSLSLLLFIFFGLTADATTYYVSLNGNDANSGTSMTSPWKTLAKINHSTFLPGDSILFRRGDTWREEIIIPSSGSPGNPITFSAYGNGAKPIINGADIITGWVNSGGNVWAVDNPNATGTRAMVILDGTIFSEVTSLNAVNSPGKYFIDVALTPNRLYVYSVTNPNTITTQISKRDYCILGRDVDLRHHLIFKNIECRYSGGHGLVLYGSQGSHFNGACIVDSCIFYGNRLSGCVAYDGHDSDIFKNSIAAYNGNGFYTWISDNNTMQNCSAAHNISYTILPNFTDGHGYGNYRSNDWLAENNISDDDADALHIDAGGVATDAIIRYNKIYNSKSGSPNTPGIGVGSLGAGATIQIYYNLIVNCSSAAFESYTLSKGTVLFYNNTIYLNNVSGTNSAVYLNYGDNFIFKNNIIVKDYVEYKTLFSVQQSPGMSTNDYNLYFILNDPGTHFRAYHNGYYDTIDAWRTATMQDVHSISSDPLFVNIASDWSLQAGSPCINAGVDVGLTKDILGNPIVGLPDMGAYEYVNANRTPIANAGYDINLTLPLTVASLIGSGTDADGTITSYSWSQISGPSGSSFTDPTASLTTVTGLTEGIYVFRLTVSDNDGASDADDVTVTVNPAPQPPIADAGADITLKLPVNSTTLTGSGVDPDGIITSYLWSKVSGPDTFTLGNEVAATTTLSNLVEGMYIFKLTVTDDQDASATDNVTVTVQAPPPSINLAPVANAGPDQTITLPVNSVILSGNDSYDPDGVISGYQWQQINGPSTCTIPSTTSGIINLSNLKEGIYVFKLVVRDNGNASGTDSVNVTVLNNSATVRSISLYPNPATGIINILLKNESQGIVHFNIYDMQGRNVMSAGEVDMPAGFFTAAIDVTRLETSVYILEVITGSYRRIVSRFAKL